MTKSDAAKRRYFAPHWKIAILKQHLLDWIPISDVFDVGASKFHDWKRRFERVNEHDAWGPRDN